MGAVTSRARAIEEPAETSLHHHSANGVDLAAGAGVIGPPIPGRSGHNYNNNFIGHNARAHFGDVHNHTVTYGQPGFPHQQAISKFQKEFLSALSFRQMSFRLTAIDPAYVETSQWVLETAEFQQWRDRTLDSDANIFWLKGKPGTGKSTIMKTLVKHLKEENSKSIVLSFFFNARGQPLEQSVEGLYRTMLHQLFSKVPSLLETTNAEQTYAHKPTWTTEMLRGLLSDAVLGLRQERIILVVDALDEGDEQEVRNMIGFARNLARSAHPNNVSLEICFASRHYPSITVPGCREVVVEGQPKHEEDIARYIHGTLYLDYGSRAYNFARAIARKARGVFLWVALVVKLLNEKYDHGATQDELIATLEITPAGLGDLLRSITSSGQPDKRLLPTLLWVFCYAGDPLNVRELYVAIQVSTGVHDKSLNHGNLRSMHRYIISASRGLVEFVPRGYMQRACRYAGNANSDTKSSLEFEDTCCIIQFIHESVREHLLTGGFAKLCPELEHNVTGKGNAMIARWYQAYIRSFSPTLTPFPTESVHGIMIDDGQISKEEINKFESSNTFAFFRRACSSTFGHVHTAFFRRQLSTKDLLGFPVMQWANMMNIHRILYPVGWDDLPRSGHSDRLQATASLLYVLISQGCQDVAMQLCRNFPVVLTSKECDHTSLPVLNAKAGPERDPLDSKSLNVVCGGHYGSPLGAAVGTMSIETVKFLLGCGADITFQGGRMGSPLQIAIRDQNMAMVQLLIGDGRSVDAPSLSSVSESSLFTAVDTGDLAMVSLLLDHGADMNKLPGQSHRLLWNAAHLGYTDIFKLLLDRGAVIDPHALCSLWIAAFDGSVGIASAERKDVTLRLLADHCGAVVNMQELSRALLIAMGPYSECKNLTFTGEDDRDLHTECELHRVQRHVCAELAFPNINTMAIMRMLLESGADPNAIGGYFETPLIAAAIMGKELYVKILLLFGADIYYRSEIYGTAVEAAAEMGWDSIVELLLQAEEEGEDEEEEEEEEEVVNSAGEETAGSAEREVGDRASTGRWETRSSKIIEDDSEDDRYWRDIRYDSNFFDSMAVGYDHTEHPRYAILEPDRIGSFN